MTVTPGPASTSTEAALPSGQAIGEARAICPYLGAVDGAWRSAVPTRDQACTAIVPPALLALDKQRRLCLTDGHRMCATFLSAASAASSGGAASAGVTRWRLVRTAPVVLDAGRAGTVGELVRSRSVPQLAFGGLLAVALAAIVLSRFSVQDPALAGAQISASPAASAAPSVAPATRRPTVPPPRSSSPAVATSASPSLPPTPNPSPAARRYRVVAGDTLYAIAIRFDTTVRAIMRENRLSSSDLRIGQVLRIP